MWFNQSDPKAAYTEQIIDYFANEGYRAKRDDDGDVVVKYEGLKLIVQVDPNDKGAFFQMLALFDASNAPDPARAILAFDIVNKSLRCVKMHHIGSDGSFAISVDAFHSSVQEYLKFVELYTGMFIRARDLYARTIAEIKNFN